MISTLLDSKNNVCDCTSDLGTQLMCRSEINFSFKRGVCVMNRKTKYSMSFTPRRHFL